MFPKINHPKEPTKVVIKAILYKFTQTPFGDKYLTNIPSPSILNNIVKAVKTS